METHEPEPTARDEASGPELARSTTPQGIDATLRQLRRLVRSSLVLRGLSLLAVAGAGLVLFSLGVDRTWRLSLVGRAVTLTLFGSAFAVLLWRLILRPLLVPLPAPVLADVVERRFPQLLDRLRSAVDFLRDPRVAVAPASEPGTAADEDLSLLLRRSVARQAVEELGRVDSSAVVDTPRVVSALSGAVAAAGFLGFLVALFPATFSLWFQRQVLFRSVEWPYRTRLEVRGFADGVRGVPRGDPLAVLVDTSGEVPVRVSIEIDYGRERVRYNMSREDEAAARPGSVVYSYRHPAVTEGFTFTASGGDFRSPPYRVRVLERPQVESLAITAEPPVYTARPAERFGAGAGEIAVPEGSVLRLDGRANKELARAWLQAEGREVPLAVSDADLRAFAGSLQPQSGGAVTVHLADRESVPPDSLLQFGVHLLGDKSPAVKFQLEGIGSMVTPQARLPMRIEAEDDYQVTALAIAWSLAGEADAETSGEEKLAGPAKPLPRVEEQHVWELGALKIQPEKRLTLRVGAIDNDGLKSPKTGFSSALSLRVVTAERLAEDFLRREEELRRVVERVIEEERQVRDVVFERLQPPAASPTGGPTAAEKASWLAKAPLSPKALGELRDLEKTERNHIRQLKLTSRGVRQILDEMKNNRVGEADDIERLAALILEPLDDLAASEYPNIEESLGKVRSGESPLAREGPTREAEKLRLVLLFESKLDKLDSIVTNMFRLEGFTEVIKRLRVIIHTQTESRRATEEEYRRAVDQLFAPEDGPSGGSSTPR
jgi:hypothetical protein